jgi:hypothetical protein
MMVHGVHSARALIRAELIKGTNPLTLGTLAKICAISPTGIEPELIQWLHLWIDTVDHDLMLIDASVELVTFHVLHPGHDSSRDLLPLINAYNIEATYIAGSEDGACLISDRSLRKLIAYCSSLS